MADILTDRQLETLAREITLAFTTDKQRSLAYAMRKPAGEDIQFIIERYQALRDENTALREIAKAVVSVPDADYDEQCPFCREMPGYTPIEHTPDCPVTKARALLAQNGEAGE